MIFPPRDAGHAPVDGLTPLLIQTALSELSQFTEGRKVVIKGEEGLMERTHEENSWRELIERTHWGGLMGRTHGENSLGRTHGEDS